MDQRVANGPAGDAPTPPEPALLSPRKKFGAWKRRLGAAVTGSTAAAGFVNNVLSLASGGSVHRAPAMVAVVLAIGCVLGVVSQMLTDRMRSKDV